MPAPIISVTQMREWEQATWASGQSETAVIARVGELVARRALALTKPGQRILLLAGKGHNGDDVRQAMPHLAAREVELINVLEPDAAQPTLELALKRCPALVVDGLFGIGLNRALAPAWCMFISRINQAGVPVLAVDVPSGLNADSGESEGAVIQSSVTLTLGAPKRGLLSPKAIPLVGRLEVAPEIGLVPCPFQSELLWTLPEDFAVFPAPRPVLGHKGSFGHAVIIAGSIGYHGAAVLAARGAQRARPGLVTLLTHPEVYVPVAAQLQATMVQPFDPKVELDRFDALLVGPGLAGTDVSPALPNVLRRLWESHERPLLVDASALDWLRPRELTPDNTLRVLTPHPGEAARLLACPVAEVQANRLGALREISQKFNGCWVVLKGHQTLVGRKSGPVFVNCSGNPDLAQGGSGDVLAGFLAGLLVQPELGAVADKALRYGVWRHGAAADLLSSRASNWVVEDLVAAMGETVS